MPLKSISYSTSADWPEISSWLSRRDAAEDNVEPLVRDILVRVRETGDEAVAEYTRRFDCPTMSADGLRVPLSDIVAALGQIPASDTDIIREAAGNIRDFHQRQKHSVMRQRRDDADGRIGRKLTKDRHVSAAAARNNARSRAFRRLRADGS